MALDDHLDKLPVFLETVRSGSIRAAARALGRSQPAVSRTIRLLEDAVGERLFVRDPSGIKLTPTGQRLFELADHVRTGVERFVARTRREPTIRQRVLLGAYESIAVYFFPGFLRYVADVQHELEISLHTARSATLMDALRRSQVDLIVSVNPTPHRNVFTTNLFSDEFRVYRHAALEITPRTPLLVFPNATDGDGRSIAAHLGRSPHARRRRYASESFEVVNALACAGLGLAVMPTRVAQRGLKSGELVEHAADAKPWRFGRHPIGVSFLRHRMGDSAVLWIVRALERFEAQRSI